MGADKYARLAELLRRLTPAAGTWVLHATVVEITGDTCTVFIGDPSQPETGITLAGVCLRASTATTKGELLITPAIDSVVLVGSLTGDLRNLAVLSVDEWSEISLKTADFTTVINKDGLRVENDGENLFSALSDLIAEIQKIIVIVGTTPNVAALEAIKQRLGKILQ